LWRTVRLWQLWLMSSMMWVEWITVQWLALWASMLRSRTRSSGSSPALG
jgi:hypothetical protein